MQCLLLNYELFHTYLFGNHFTLLTDYKPLLALLNEHQETPPQASARIRLWSLFLSAYKNTCTLTFQDTQADGNADSLSRLPLPWKPKVSCNPPELVLLTQHLSDSPITADHNREWIDKDPPLVSVKQYIQGVG